VDLATIQEMERSVAARVLVVLWLIYAGARVLQAFPTRVPTLLIVILHVVPAAAFALVHGWRRYGMRLTLLFAGLCLAVASAFESLSLRTGFPFGHYDFTGVMGPKVLQLPVLLALAYVGVGYVSWIVAESLVGSDGPGLPRLLVTPVVASCAMTAWDLAMDPVWANIDRAWVWRDGGVWFGVPLSNYFGWMLTTWVFYQAFALIQARRDRGDGAPGWARLAILMYATVALGNVFVALPSAVPAGYPRIIVDTAGRRWILSNVIGVCLLISVCVMCPLALAAWVRTRNQRTGRKSGEAPLHPDSEPVTA